MMSDFDYKLDPEEYADLVKRTEELPLSWENSRRYWKRKSAIRNALYQAELTGDDVVIHSPDQNYIVDGETLEINEYEND